MSWIPQDGQNIRFYSKLGTDMVLAASPNLEFPCYIHHLSNGPAPEATVFQVSLSAGEDYDFQLYLRNVPGAGDQKLSWSYAPNGPFLVLNGGWVDSGVNDYFSYDTLDPDPWIAINNYVHDHVVDVFEFASAEGSRVDAFPWNGGDNQWWRVVPV